MNQQKDEVVRFQRSQKKGSNIWQNGLRITFEDSVKPINVEDDDLIRKFSQLCNEK